MNSSLVCPSSVTPWHKDQHLSHSCIHQAMIRDFPTKCQAWWSLLRLCRGTGQNLSPRKIPYNSNKLAYHPLHLAELPWTTAYASFITSLGRLQEVNVNSVPDWKIKSLDGKTEDHVLSRGCPWISLSSSKQWGGHHSPTPSDLRLDLCTTEYSRFKREG